MMKCMFVMVLLQVCRGFPVTSFTPDSNLNGELLNDLRELEKNVNRTMLTSIPTPGRYMLKHPSRCVYAFSQKLRIFLESKSMTLEGTARAIIERLVLNLESLPKHHQQDRNCTMDGANKTNSFIKHKDFIRKLNSGR